MKLDEKACPQCAEAIKKAAIVCRYCGHRFSAEEVVEIADEQKNKADQEKRANDMAMGCAALIVLFVAGFVIYQSISGTPQSEYKRSNSSAESRSIDISKLPRWKIRINPRGLSANYGVLAGTVSITNSNEYNIKDVVIACSTKGRSGSYINEFKETAFVVVKAGETVTTKRIVFGIADTQSASIECEAASAERA